MIEAMINLLKDTKGKGLILVIVAAIVISLINVAPAIYTELNKTKSAKTTINRNDTVLIIYRTLYAYNEGVINHFDTVLDSEFQLSETDFLVQVNQGLMLGWEAAYSDIDRLPLCVENLADYVRSNMVSNSFKIDVVKVLTDGSQTKEFKLTLIKNLIKSYQFKTIENLRTKLAGEKKCAK